MHPTHLILPTPPPIPPCRCQPGDRLELLTLLESNHIQTRVCFSGNVTRHPAYRDKYLQAFPNADAVMSDAFLLGAHHGLTQEDVDYVCDHLIAFAESKKKK